MRRILTRFVLIMMLPSTALAVCEAEQSQGAQAWYACMVLAGQTQVPSGADAQCAAQAAAGLIPAFYCQPGPKPPIDGGYPTGSDVRPQPVYKECTPCVGMNALDPERCTPVEEYSQDACDAKKAHGDDQVLAPAADVFHADGAKWSDHYAAAKAHAGGMEVRALRAEALASCLGTARNRKTCYR